MRNISIKLKIKTALVNAIATSIIVITATLIAAIPKVQAKQIIEIKADGEKAIMLSNLELNRLKASNDRIIHIRGNDGEFDMVSDKESGEVYIKPKTEQTHIFVSTEKGYTYKIGIKARGIEAQQVFLDNIEARIKSESGKRAQEKGAASEALMVIKAMRSGKVPEGYVVSAEKTNNRVLERKLRVKVIESTKLINEKYTGEKLVIKIPSKKKLSKSSNKTADKSLSEQITENAFYGDDVIAVSMDYKECPYSNAGAKPSSKGQSNKINSEIMAYIVKQRNDVEAGK
jgi:hypothetical protein